MLDYLDYEEATQFEEFLDEYKNGSGNLLALLEQLSNLDPRSEKFKKLQALFDKLFLKIKEKTQELEGKQKIKQFVEELDLSDVEQECRGMANARAEYVILTTLQGAIKTDPNISDIEKKRLAKQCDIEFEKVTDFSDAEQLEAMRTNLETELAAQGGDNADIEAALADITNQEAIREIALGQRVDYMGSTKHGLGTHQKFHGILGEIGASMQLLRDNLDTDNDKNSYMAKITDHNANHLVTSLRTQNQPNLPPPPPKLQMR